jgi:hypothetical protein
MRVPNIQSVGIFQLKKHPVSSDIFQSKAHPVSSDISVKTQPVSSDISVKTNQSVGIFHLKKITQ